MLVLILLCFFPASSLAFDQVRTGFATSSFGIFLQEATSLVCRPVTRATSSHRVLVKFHSCIVVVFCCVIAYRAPALFRLQGFLCNPRHAIARAESADFHWLIFISSSFLDLDHELDRSLLREPFWVARVFGKFLVRLCMLAALWRDAWVVCTLVRCWTVLPEAEKAKRHGEE